MNTILPYLLLVASLVIVDGSHIAKVVGVRDASGQCICTMHLANVVFPAPRVEQLESDFYNLTNQLQEQLNEIYNGRNNMSIITTNLTDLAARIKYAKTYGTHIDLNFDKVINDLQSVIAVAQDISKNATTDSTKKLVDSLIEQINNINTAVTTMEGHDKNNIVTIQREINNLRKKLQECEEAIASGAGLANLSMSPPVGSCNHDGLLRVNGPILVKLNWKGADFKAGAWGKDFALGAKSPDHYWVFPANKNNYTLESFRLYSSYRKLMLYFPVMEFSLQGANDKCENCGQGAGVIFYNGSFYYNCYHSRDLCKIDPQTLRLLHKELEDEDPPSFNNMFSYKGVEFQDMDMAGDEKGLWMIHGSKVANGNMVIRKVNPDTLQLDTPWTTSQKKRNVSNAFMICGVLYATKRVNSTHEVIFYAFDTNSAKEHSLRIFLNKPLPTMQSLSYNPNDQKLYMYNDGYLVYYDVKFKPRVAKRAGPALAADSGLDIHDGKSQSLVVKSAQSAADKEDRSLGNRQQKTKTSKGEISAIHESRMM
ncbi:olfactomedin-like isoform X2 [Anolis carolinensis]|uniref:olfactomedin-like isoform X2 n=1 Tax=Anolis carolinensis TaxID=28377 RepID=UPI002F2B177F